MIPEGFFENRLVYFAQGKRSKIYTFMKGRKRFAVKVEDEKSGAFARLENEVRFLKRLKKYNIGPKVVKCGGGFMAYEFVEGMQILEFLKNTDNPVPVLKEILRQCRVLDRLGINKLEMHHPLKHIFIKGEKVVMIDFERCYKTKKPKNVTQFCQFLLRCPCLKLEKEVFMKKIKKYKAGFSAKSFKELVEEVKC